MNQPFYSDQEVYVGRDAGGRTYEVTPELIVTYAAGTDDDNPLYREASFAPTPVAPALLFHSEVYKDLGWYLPNLIGNLHAVQEWQLFRPMLVGDVVRSRSTVVERYRKRNRDYIVNEVLFTDADGRWLQRSRTHQSFLIDDGSEGYVVDKDREKRADRVFAIGAGEGEELPALAKTITLEMCQAFSGPVPNYHTDRDIARAFGFPDVVVQGMMSVCFVSELMTRAFGAGWFHGGQLEVKLVNVVWPDDVLAVRGKVVAEVPEGRRMRVQADVWCEKEDGVKTVVGRASALR